MNTCYDLARKRDRRKPEIREKDTRSEIRELPAACAWDHPLRLTLQQHLEKLDKRRLMVFLLFEVEGLKHREIAEILNISESMSKTVLFEAKRELQKRIWKDNTFARIACEDRMQKS